MSQKALEVSEGTQILFWEFWQVIVGFVPEMQHNMTGSYQNSEEQK